MSDHLTLRLCAASDCEDEIATTKRQHAKFCSELCRDRESKRRWRKDNPERARGKSRESMRRWRKDNPERARENSRRWYEENRERRAETNRRWYEANRGRVSENSRRWRVENPEKNRANAQRRHALKRNATVEHFTDLEIFERDNWTCGLCHNPIDPSLSYPDPSSVSLDHIVPLSKGGEHSRANTQAAHLRCNSSKGARLPEELTAA